MKKIFTNKDTRVTATVIIVITIVIIICISVLITRLMKDKNKRGNLTVEDFETMKIKHNGKVYNVVDFEDKEISIDSAETLEEILRRVNKLIDILNKMKFNGTRNEHWTSSKIIENLAESGQTSYSINKGEQIALCLRNTNNNLHDINTLMFVAIHELAHNYNVDEIGHTNHFWKLMKQILDIAEKHKLYTYVDYSETPVNYCGMVINNTP